MAKFPGQPRLASELLSRGVSSVTGEREKLAVLSAFCHVDVGIDELTEAVPQGEASVKGKTR